MAEKLSFKTSGDVGRNAEGGLFSSSCELAATYGLEKQIEDRLNSRLAGDSDYCADELDSVMTRSPRLFPEEFELDEKTTELFRGLATFSQIESRLKPDFKSHRPFIGKFIVAAKKTSWPIIRLHLKPTLNALKEQNDWVLQTLAKQIQQTDKLERRLEKLENK